MGPLVDDIGALAASRPLLVVTHHQTHARRLGGTAVLIAGGRVQEVARTDALLRAPRTEAARQFVESGNCRVPSPMATAEELAPDVERPPPLPPPALAAPRARGPRGFFWLYPGKLGGLPRPGIVSELDDDVRGLVALGVTVLISLEEEVRVTMPAWSGIRQLSFPIRDMSAPSLDDARRTCAEIAALVAGGDVVALHCRAGHGRTGTMLAATLVHEGASAIDALTRVRAIHARWVQSDEQVAFIERFERLERSGGVAREDHRRARVLVTHGRRTRRSRCRSTRPSRQPRPPSPSAWPSATWTCPRALTKSRGALPTVEAAV